MLIMKFEMIIMMIIMVILMIIMTKMTKKHTISVKFEKKMLFEGLILGKKKGPKNPGMGRPPPPPHSGNARKKTFFSIDVFPKAVHGFVKVDNWIF